MLVSLLLATACREHPDIPGLEGVLEYRFVSPAWGLEPEAMALGSTELLIVGPIHHPVFFDEDKLESYLYLEATGFRSLEPELLQVEVADHLRHDDEPILQPEVKALGLGDARLEILGPEGEVVDTLLIEIAPATTASVVDDEPLLSVVEESHFYTLLAQDEHGRLLAASEGWVWEVQEPEVALLEPVGLFGEAAPRLEEEGERVGMLGQREGETTVLVSRPGLSEELPLRVLAP